MVRIKRLGMPKKSGTKRYSFGTFWHILGHFFAFFDTFLHFLAQLWILDSKHGLILSLLKDPAPITPIVKSNWCCGFALCLRPPRRKN